MGRVAAAVGAVALCVAASARAGAQGKVAEEGGLFLLLPIGAQSVGMGQAMAASRPGSEGVWWNPASLATLDKREAAIHHSQSVVGTGDALTVLVPSSLLGTIALSASLLNFGEEDLVPPGQEEAAGKLLPRAFAYAATYATSIGARVNAGVTYKVVQLRFDCTGPCPDAPYPTATTSALDFGTQVDLGAGSPLTLALAARNVGLRLQVNDSPQSDPLPGRFDLGARYRLGGIKKRVPDLEIGIAGDVVTDLRLTMASARVGTDVVWQKRAHLRLGYVAESGDAGGPSVGLGITSGSFGIDIARLFTGLSADVGQAPTYLSLRYLF